MDLISLVIVLAVLGLIWYLVTNYIPMPPPIKVVVNVVCVVILIVFLLREVLPYLGHGRVI